MDSVKFDAVLNFISREYGIEYIDLLHTLSNYSLIPLHLKSRYSKLSKFKCPAIRLIVEKYNIDSKGYTPKNKMKIINLKEQIKMYSKQLEVKYIYLVFIKRFGLETGLDFINSHIK